MHNKLLLIYEDTSLCELLANYLLPEGVKVEAVKDGMEGVSLALAGGYDLVLLEARLPNINGIDVLRSIRQRSHVPLFMLAACADEVDRIVGLEMGADDYLVKPLNPRELLARLRAIQRRSLKLQTQQATKSPIVEVDDIAMNVGTRTVLRGGVPLAVTSLEFSILEVLLRMAGTVVTHQELIRQALGRDPRKDDRNITFHICSLRRKMGPPPSGSERIKSIRGVGYLYSYSAFR